MDFSSERFLKSHIASILDFYSPVIVDENGGFYQNFKDDGTVFDPGQRHLVSSCRMVFIFCKAYQLYNDEKYLERAIHGIEFIRQHHFDSARNAYNWTLKNTVLEDDQTNHCYGLAFVLLCFSAAHEVGVDGAQKDIKNAFSLLEKRFWLADSGLYADEATLDWKEINAYRGQNSNMHCCEAMLAAYEATRDKHYLERAYQLAKTVTQTLTSESGGLIWEHYTEDLNIDWLYNKHDPKNLYRPWGFQPGHQTEWTKLLLTLYEHQPEKWMVDTAAYLFDKALSICWDEQNGGIYYGFSPDQTICDDDKYFWVQAESFAAAARLFCITKEEKYAQWYKKIWRYSWDHMVDHKYGAWFRVLTVDNKKMSDEKSTAGGKCDYHTIGACWDVIRSGYCETIAS